MLVRDLQQVLGNFTDKFNKGMGKVEGKGNAIMYAKVYVDLGNGRLSQIQKIEAHEKLCRIMQRQTFDQIKELKAQIVRIERLLIGTAAFVIISLLDKVF